MHSTAQDELPPGDASSASLYLEFGFSHKPEAQAKAKKASSLALQACRKDSKIQTNTQCRQTSLLARHLFSDMFSVPNRRYVEQYNRHC